ncbi:MAG: hypothetical protein FJX72_22005, partial [Armatimonadetes bacterium]|nr:hypothetical protein [Armatimonadota bacterium]
MTSVKVIVERRGDGCVASPLGLEGVCVAQRESYDDALREGPRVNVGYALGLQVGETLMLGTRDEWKRDRLRGCEVGGAYAGHVGRCEELCQRAYPKPIKGRDLPPGEAGCDPLGDFHCSGSVTCEEIERRLARARLCFTARLALLTHCWATDPDVRG